MFGFGGRSGNHAPFGSRMSNGLRFGSRIANTIGNVLGTVGTGLGAVSAILPNPVTAGLAAAATTGGALAKVAGSTMGGLADAGKSNNKPSGNMLHQANYVNSMAGQAPYRGRPNVPAGRHMAGGAAAQAGPSRARGGGARDFRRSALEAP